MKSHDIKDILEERKIEVSENSWEKLANKLDANDQKKKRKSFYPYAACLALLVSFIVFMMLKTETAIGTETIVKTETEVKSNSTKVDSQELIIPKEIEKIAIENTVVTAQKDASKIISNRITSKETTQLEVELHKETQNSIVVNKKVIVPKGIETVIVEKEVIVDPNSALKASIAALSATEKIAITDEEINQLLKEAQQSLRKLDVQEDVDITTFATADELLEEVELELDKSFKQKVYELIKSNIKKSRTVIADRD